MQRISILLIGFICFQTTLSFAKEESNVFFNPTSGFTITKPPEWSFISTQAIEANRARVQLEDQKLQELMQKQANAPLVAFTRYPEPYENLNPSVQVILRPLGPLQGMPAMKVLNFSVKAMERAFSDFHLIHEVQETEISGLPAAYMRARYTVANQEGQQFPTLSRMWIIPRGSYMFLISMSGPGEGSDVLENYFQQILESIKIEK